jgi:hypothetical protein
MWKNEKKERRKNEAKIERIKRKMAAEWILK